MFEQFKNKLLLDDEKKKKYAGYFKRIEVAGKTILLKEGDISKKIFWIEKGCIRVWFNNEGEDISFQFFFEDSAVASIESFRKNIASPITIETIEPCILWYISKNDFDKIINEISEIPALRNIFIEAVFERTFDYMKHCLSYIKDKPEQRYLELLKDKPQIVQRIPQHHIASYLGITKVHLSRIKGKLAKKK
ncbi:MAG: Crp/Fnr family transcriptional regulator [Ferruginibacter sp.]